MFWYNGLEDGNGVADVDVDDVGGDDVDYFEVVDVNDDQGGRSCAKALRAFVKKFGLGRKF